MKINWLNWIYFAMFMIYIVALISLFFEHEACRAAGGVLTRGSQCFEKGREIRF